MNDSSMTVRENLRRPRSLIGPLWTKMFLSRIIQRGARTSLPRRKDQDTAADLQGENAHVRSLLSLGLAASCDGHSASSESAV